MYEVPSRKDVERVVITGPVVLEHVNPTLVPARPAARRPRARSPRNRLEPRTWTLTGLAMTQHGGRLRTRHL